MTSPKLQKNNKPTDGPWSWRLFGDTYCLVAEHGRREIIIGAIPHGEMGYPVVAMNIDGALRDVDEDHPNAQLIAAAPDMYDALKRVADLRDLLQYPDNINEERYGEAKAINDMITDVNKAIAKAEGKEEQR